MKKSRVISFIFMVLIAFACQKENEEDLVNGNSNGDNGNGDSSSCSTENMSYEDDIAPVFANNCNSCHNDQNASGGVKTNTYDNLQPIIDNGSLLGSIKHESGFSNMPQGQGQLPQCTIDKIEAWIDQGHEDN